MAENLANDFATTLAGAVDNSTGTLTVVLASGAPAPNFRIRVDDELMLVTAVAGTTWTVTRGIEGTAAASHASGAVVVHVLTAGALAALLAALGVNPSFTGNLTLSSVGARIRGDFSNATPSNRVGFQSNVTNGDTRLIAVPNGTATVSGLFAFNSSDPSNSHWAAVACTATSAVLASTYIGSPGAALPLSIDIGGVTRSKYLPTGEVGIGVTPEIGQGTLQVQNINGGATSGFKNKIVNGCMRISRMGNGVAILGPNRFGADGLITFIGGWSAVTGAIITRDTQAINDLRYTTGAAHYISLGTCTGASGYVIFQTRIEAADAQELGGKPVTASARLHAWATAPSNYYFRIYKANAVNDFSAQTLVSQSSSFGSLAVNTTVTPTHTFTIPAADCVTGAQVELVVEYTGTVAASSYLFLGDYQFSASSKREPFELRPIAIEEQMRARYLRQQQVWVGTSTARTVMPIDMVKTPTITGGGAGYTSTGTDKDTLVCYQTTAGLQTLTLNSEL